jgi:hypothetical protein
LPCDPVLYQLKVYNLKIILSVRGSKATNRVCMARERTLVEAWMGTFDEADFCFPIYPVRHIYFMRREGASESTVLLLWSLSP